MLNEKFCKKYMRLAKQIGEDSNPCLSRSIGIIIVHPEQNRIMGAGYNGPPRKTPHPDDPDYLREIVWPQLTDAEKLHAKANTVEEFVDANANKGVCPRRIIGAASGVRLELCSCEHGEKNAIYNTVESLHEAWMFCWCGVPCWNCSKAIINAKIKRVVCVDHGGPDYSVGSRWLLWQAGVPIELRDPETLDVTITISGRCI